MAALKGVYKIAIGRDEDQCNYTVNYNESKFGRIARKVGHFVSATLFSVGLTCLFQTHHLMLNGTISMVGLMGLAFVDNRGAKATMIADHILQQSNEGYSSFELIIGDNENLEIVNIALSRLSEEVSQNIVIVNETMNG